MPRKIFKRFLPDPAKVKDNPYLKVLGSAVHNSDLWHLNKRSISGAFFIGIFCGFQPILFQMVLAGFLAILFKRNLPLSVSLVFITNPLTLGPIFYLNYWVGTRLIGGPAETFMNIEHLWEQLTTNFDAVGWALLLGSLICGLIAGFISYVVVNLFWVWRVKRNWRQRLRRQRKAVSKSRQALSDNTPSSNS